MKKKVFPIMLLLFVLMTVPMTALAKSSDPYKDVTRKTVDSQSYTAISYIKRFNGWNGIVTKGRLSPNKYMTRREFLIVLHNLYGNKITFGISDIINANSKITSKFACDRMVALSKKLKYPIRWTGTKTKLKRKDVARYIYIFATFNKKLVPKK